MQTPGDLPGDSLALEARIEFCFACFIVFVRCISRIQAAGIGGLKLDDWGMQAAVILFAFLVLISRLVAATIKIDASINPKNMPIALALSLANNGMTDEYRANLNPAAVEYQLRVAGSKLHLSAWSLYVSTLWCLKLCVAIFYTRLTDCLPHMKFRITIAYLSIGVTYIIVMVTLLGACQPFPRYWQINPNPGNHCMPAVSSLNGYVFILLHAITNLYLLHIPILMLCEAGLPVLKRFCLIFLFSCGLFPTVGGILRIYFILMDGRNGGREAAHWAVRELFATFVVTNLPVIYGDVRIIIKRIRNPRRSQLGSRV